jgi:hypothetical protein
MLENSTSKLNKSTNNNNSNDILTNNIKPTYPPIITIYDLIKPIKPKLPPNSFFIYRIALIKEYRIKNYKLPPMVELSKIAKKYWDMEPKNVKDFYASLAKDAKSFYFKYFSDNYEEVTKRNQNQKCDATRSAVENINENHHIQDIFTSDQNNNATNTSQINNSPNYDNSYDLNSMLEYIRILEQIIDYYLP